MLPQHVQLERARLLSALLQLELPAGQQASVEQLDTWLKQRQQWLQQLNVLCQQPPPLSPDACRKIKQIQQVTSALQQQLAGQLQQMAAMRQQLRQARPQQPTSNSGNLLNRRA